MQMMLEALTTLPMQVNVPPQLAPAAVAEAAPLESPIPQIDQSEQQVRHTFFFFLLKDYVSPPACTLLIISVIIICSLILIIFHILAPAVIFIVSPNFL
jgi:hypothetical protein